MGKNCFGTESGRCYPDGRLGDRGKHEFLFFNCVTSEDYGNFPEYSNVVDSKLSTIFCNTNEVSHLLRNLNPHESAGPDHLPTRVLKECTIEIASPFCLFQNRSFLAGEVPYAWKIANIVPVHKKGRKDYRENYRQISLTSVACKVSEKIVKDRVVNFWQAPNVLTQTNLDSWKENQL